MARVEVLSGPERRRRWSEEQKRAIVTAAFEPGAVVRDVARRADVTPGLIYRWRRGLQAAANGFARVLVAPSRDEAKAKAKAEAEAVAAPSPAPVPAMELEFAGSARVRIPASIPPALAAAVIEALARQ